MAGWHISHPLPSFKENKIPCGTDVGLAGHGLGRCWAAAEAGAGHVPGAGAAAPSFASLAVLLKRLKKKRAPLHLIKKVNTRAV